MNKKDLKQLIKPLVKECIQEVLLEEGLLSNVVSEVVKGMNTQQMVVESKAPPPPKKQKSVAKTKLSEHRKKMLDAIGRDAYNGVDLFEGTNPEGMTAPKPGTTDLGNPGDAGVDISSIMGDAAKIWQAMK